MRTDHSNHIQDLRDEADRLSTALVLGVSAEEKDLRVKTLRAAADLLEIHDATGLNLAQAPDLQAFVEAVLEHGLGAHGVTVTDNNA